MRQVEAEQLTLFELGPDLAKIREEAAMWKESKRAKSTAIAYDCDWRKFVAWCASAGRATLPALPETLELFCAAQLRAHHKITAIQRYVAAITAKHRDAKVAIPDRAGARAILLGAAKRLKERPKRRSPLTPDQLRRMCKLMVADGGAKAVRDRALITLGFASAIRRSSLVDLNLWDVRFEDRGVVITLQSSKTDQEGKGQEIGIRAGANPQTCPVRALRAWLKIRGDANGPLFLRIEESGKPSMRRMKPDTANQQVKKWVKAIGVDVENYGTHSLRAGFVTTAHLEGTNIIAIMERTGHKSFEQVREYVRNADPFAGANPLGQAI